MPPLPPHVTFTNMEGGGDCPLPVATPSPETIAQPLRYLWRTLAQPLRNPSPTLA